MKLKIGFLGAPFSGKSTAAAFVFAELKRLGYPVEFLPEYARTHIRQRREEAFIQNIAETPLLDVDQIVICRGQWEEEQNILRFSGESVILVTDGSTLNAHFYVKQEIFDPVKMLDQYDLLFFARNIERSSQSVDGNRVHDADFSKEVDAQIKQFLTLKAPLNVIELDGDVETRVSKALSTIAEALKHRENKLQ